MFADSLLETSWAYRTRRSWTTLTSFGLQAAIIGLILLIPLGMTVGLPLSRTVSTPLGVFRRNPGPTPHPSGPRTGVTTVIPYKGRIMAPSSIPPTISRTSGPVSESVEPYGIYIGPSRGSGPELPVQIYGTRVMPTIAPPPATIRREFRTSSMLEGSLIRRVQPVYPPLARSARIQGSVVLAAVIGKDGTMQNLKLISGHPMLVPAAVDAVSQWRYRPYILNGEPIEVETQITVNFVLAGN